MPTYSGKISRMRDFRHNAPGKASGTKNMFPMTADRVSDSWKIIPISAGKVSRL
ncbi:MAG TPA: hypothetical protein VJ919_08430 [Tangfeifania sp.]|nr:hypothetical protein [Tangfeifania sp.]